MGLCPWPGVCRSEYLPRYHLDDPMGPVACELEQIIPAD